jgi:DNA repair exonuclease SbcCD nuclease subunit
MQYPTLLVADWHLTDNPRDEYRWALFDWLRETCVAEKVKTLIFLGDLTDSKDNHSAALTNRIVSGFRTLAQVVKDIKLLPGNHDWLLGGQEYFRFLNVIPGVEYITEPCEDQDVNGPSAFYLPFSKNPARDWARFDFSHYRYVFCHQTIKGAISSNGEAMEGEDMPDLSAAGKVYSGDIHVPQVIGPVEYVGSPMHIHFGDDFVPRCVLLERGSGRPVDLHFKTLRRVTVKVAGLRELERREFRAGDQVKLRVELAESEKHEWSRLRRLCVDHLKAAGVEVAGVELILKKSTRRTINEERQQARTPADAVLRFVEDEELGGEALDIGLEIVES